ncbi:MAG TPA: GtrA family protein [Terriglobales bacterium]|jgi:putative flippase GtrA|nr:GtrA family protein [Terriglobales bacterium]
MKSTGDAWGTTGVRWLKFNFVGGLGIGVQLLVLAVLKSGLHLGYLIATALAVEAAVVHNFVWHERFTWADREAASRLARFLKFNLTTGMFSILGNLLLMKLLVGVASLNYLVANIITIAACSLVNFVVSDSFVFAVGSEVCRWPRISGTPPDRDT